MWPWPLHAGLFSLYPFYGFWELIDVNVYATGRLVWEPGADLDALTGAWVSRFFGPDPEAVARVKEVLFLSQEAILKGLYIGAYARKQVMAMGIEVPPRVWVWDVVSGSNILLSGVCFASRDSTAQAIEEGFEAVETVRRMQALVREIDREAVRRPEVYDHLWALLVYEVHLLETLACYRKVFLSFFAWLDTGDALWYRMWAEVSELCVLDRAMRGGQSKCGARSSALD